MRLFDGDKGFYCYVCHAGGDVIRLVEAVNQCGFKAAIEWLNSAFQLGLVFGHQTDKNVQKAAEIARKRREMERKQREAIERAEFDLYTMATKLLNDLEADAERYRPTRPYAEWDKRWADAMWLIPEARELCQDMAMEVIGR